MPVHNFDYPRLHLFRKPNCFKPFPTNTTTDVPNDDYYMTLNPEEEWTNNLATEVSPDHLPRTVLDLFV